MQAPAQGELPDTGHVSCQTRRAYQASDTFGEAQIFQRLQESGAARTCGKTMRGAQGKHIQPVERVRRMSVESSPRELTDTPSLSPRGIVNACLGVWGSQHCFCLPYYGSFEAILP